MPPPPWQWCNLRDLSLHRGQVGDAPTLRAGSSEWESPPANLLKMQLCGPPPRSWSQSFWVWAQWWPVFTEPRRRCLCCSGVRPAASGGCWRIGVAHEHLAQGLARVEAPLPQLHRGPCGPNIPGSLRLGKEGQILLPEVAMTL